MKLKTQIVLIIVLAIIYFPSKAQTNGMNQISIHNLRSKPIIKTVLNGKVAYFLLDTGSDLTILNSKVSKKYDFQMFNNHDYKVTLSGLGSTGHDISRVFNAKLALNGSMINTKFYAYDLSNIVQSLYLKTKIRIAGIIGSDMMKKYKFSIDYGERVINFNDFSKKKNREKDLELLVDSKELK